MNSCVDNASRVFEAKPVVIKSDGSEINKGNNRGVSSFFPQNWDNNPNEYYGFSKDGKVEIHFYYNADGSIGSFFPKKR